MKLRSGKTIYKSVSMDKNNEIQEEGCVGTSEMNVNSSDSSSITNGNPSLLNMLRTVLNNVVQLKERFDLKIDDINSNVTKHLEGYKLELNNAFVNLQTELRSSLDTKWDELRKDLEGKILEKLMISNEICRQAQKKTMDGNVTLQSSDLNCNTRDKTSANSTSYLAGKEGSIENINSSIPKKDVTPMKALSLPCISESPEFSRNVTSSTCISSVGKSVILPCTMLPNSALQNLPLLTSNSSIVVSALHQSVKPLRTLRPKPATNDELIVSDFDGNTEDQVRPTHVFSVGGERVSLPPRVRTRGGFRRIESKPSSSVSSCEKNKDATGQGVFEKLDSNRGGRRGRKSRQFLSYRRQSERLKKSDSPKKTSELEKALGDTPLEEFLWGNNSNDDNSLDNNTIKGTDEDKTSELNTSNKVKLSNKESGEKNVMDDEIQNLEMNPHLQHDKDNEKLETLKKNSKQNSILGKDDHTESLVENKNITEKTPRNFPSKKGLSLSSPRKGSHIRVLDFATPLKPVPSRRANTSPKAASLGKLSQIKSLRRTNLFKSPVKKSKSSWDADLRAFVEPDIPVSANNIKKRPQPKRPGRPQKFYSPKKKIALSKKYRKSSKTPSKPKRDKVLVNEVSNNDESPSETTDELVKKIEKDVLEVISEGIRNSNNSGNISEESCNIEKINIVDKQNNPNQENISLNTSSSPVNTSLLEKSAKTPFLVPTKTPAKNLNKTPAKLDFSGLISSHLMTPVTKILKEQSSLLENVTFLTPGFLPTPDNINCSLVDARKAGTPSPRSMKQSKISESDSDQSDSPIKECPVRIEEALAAEEAAVKPVKKNSPSKSVHNTKNSELSDKTVKKKKSTAHNKSGKKKSIEEILIDQCLKNVEKDLYRDAIPFNSPKKSMVTHNDPDKKHKQKLSLKNETNCLKNVNDPRNKKKSSIHPTEKKISNERNHGGIKLPSFEEMMSKLDEMNKLSSSSSACDSDDEIRKKEKDGDNGGSGSSDSFPRLRVSEDESTCSVSADNRLKIRNQYATSNSKFSKIRSIKGEVKQKIRQVTSKENSKSLPIPCVSEQIKDFSYTNSIESPLKEFSLYYFDKGKDDYRKVAASQVIHLLNFPLIDKPKMDDKVHSKSPKKDIPSEDTSAIKDFYFKDKNEDASKPLRDEVIARTETFESDYFGRMKGESQSKFREDSHSSRNKLSLSSHRSRYLYDKRMTSVERRYRRRSRERHLDTPHRRYKRERAHEYRVNLSRRSPGLRDHSRHSRRECDSGDYRSNIKDKRFSNTIVQSHKTNDNKLLEKKIIEKRREAIKPSKDDSKSFTIREMKENVEGTSNRTFSKDSREGYCQEFVDIKISSRSKDSQEFLESKPIAESTPYSVKTSLTDPRKYPRSDEIKRTLCSDTIESPERINSPVSDGINKLSDPCLVRSLHRLSRVSEEGELYESDMSQIKSYNQTSPSDPRLKKSSVIMNVCDFKLSSSNVQVSPESPPTDLRSIPRSTNYNAKNSSLRKRKLSEDKEEGEISDDSSASFHRSTPSYVIQNDPSTKKKFKS